MSKLNYNQKIEKVYNEAKRISIDKKSRIVLMSDCHRGTGGWNDNFANNEKIYFAALSYYYREGFTYIELGDGDELWENRDYSKIINSYSHIFWLLSKFYEENRLYMLYGNHDLVKKNPEFRRRYLNTYYCDSEETNLSLLPQIEIPESIILEDRYNFREIFLIHGHQGELLNDQLWHIGRWLVRYLWKPLEILGVHNPTEPESIYNRDRGHLNRLERWADENRKITIGGHTHHPKFAQDGYYYNTGSCVHPRCIIAIELKCRNMRLVKWCVEVDENQYLQVRRNVLEEGTLDEIFNHI